MSSTEGDQPPAPRPLLAVVRAMERGERRRAVDLSQFPFRKSVTIDLPTGAFQWPRAGFEETLFRDLYSWEMKPGLPRRFQQRMHRWLHARHELVVVPLDETGTRLLAVKPDPKETWLNHCTDPLRPMHETVQPRRIPPMWVLSPTKMEPAAVLRGLGHSCRWLCKNQNIKPDEDFYWNDRGHWERRVNPANLKPLATALM